MAMLFAYNTLRYMRPFDDIKLDIITFGAPNVFAHVQTKKDELIETLSKISHHYINADDPVPRLLGGTDWIRIPKVAKHGKSEIRKWSYVPDGGVTDKALTEVLKIYAMRI